MYESTTTIEDYIDKAKKLGSVPAICISEHGSVSSWVSKMNKVKKSGLKYIHAMEAFVTDDNNETDPKKLSRDNYHLLIIAKNYQGVRELNRLSSNAFNRSDNHYYYKPRIFFDEIASGMNSGNLVLTSACLGSPLWQNYKNGNTENLSKWIGIFVNNKDNAYLEVQPHNHPEQIEYNELLLKLSAEHGLNIVATNDVHNLDEEHSEIAKMIKASRGIVFDTDDDFDTTYKTRDEMAEAFAKQGVLSSEEIEIALDNTMRIVNQIEDFELDTSPKYPHLFSESEQLLGSFDLTQFREKPFTDSLDIFKHLIVQGYYDRGIEKKAKDEQEKYRKQVNHELKTYISTDSIDYMLLEYVIKKEARDKIIDPNKAMYPGFGRGSVGGSLIAYLLRVTDIDPIVNNLLFERFMSPDRVGLPDVDSDWKNTDRDKIQNYLLSSDRLNCAAIMTLGTTALKGSVKMAGKAMGYSPTETDAISKAIEANDNIVPLEIEEEHKELFERVSVINGVTSQTGRHASGIVVSTEDLKELIGLQTLSNFDGWITQISMTEIDEIGLVKLDVLGLDNISLIENTSIFSGLPRLTPDSVDEIDFEDDAVWESIRQDNTGIFQFESPRAGGILADILHPDNVKKVRETNPNVRRIDLMSFANALQRPSGASMLDSARNHELNDNGHEALNALFSDTMNYMVYQEQSMEFLVEFAGFSRAESDRVRKGIGKKLPEIMDEEVPRIKPNFVSKMTSEYGVQKDEAERIADSFIRIFMDSVNYGFNRSHSVSYSFLGYLSGYLRYYHPLEFTAAALEIWQKTDKEKLFLDFAEKQGISINPPKFKKSRDGYFMDKENNAIYQSTSHIKGNNGQTANMLYGLKDRDYFTFTDFVIDVIENGVITMDGNNMTVQEFYRNHTEDEIKAIDKEWKSNPELLTLTQEPLGLNKTKILGLIRLDFFSEEFPEHGAKKLEQIYDFVISKYKPRNKTFSGKHQRYFECLEFEKSLPMEEFSIMERCEHELFYTGRVTVQSDIIPPKYAFVTKIHNVGKSRTSAEVYSINKGAHTDIKVNAKTYKQASFKEGDLVELQKLNVRAKSVQQDGRWVSSPTEKEIWVSQLKFIRKGEMK